MVVLDMLRTTVKCERRCVGIISTLRELRKARVSVRVFACVCFMMHLRVNTRPASHLHPNSTRLLSVHGAFVVLALQLTARKCVSWRSTNAGMPTTTYSDTQVGLHFHSSATLAERTQFFFFFLLNDIIFMTRTYCFSLY